MPATSFTHRLGARPATTLIPHSIDVLQVNLTRLCNQSCAHCHMDSSPSRTEMMARATVERCLEVLSAHPEITTLDLTGGAPELHPDFAHFVRAARELRRTVIVRHNLTVTMDPHPLTAESMAHLPDLFASHRVEVVASLPCYEQTNTDRQRGRGTFQKSIESLLRLNALGYGRPDSGLVIHLVHNPGGAHLPRMQHDLEREYRRVLSERYGIAFNSLYAITNMPIARFKTQLRRRGDHHRYLADLSASYNSETVDHVMCRRQVSVAPDGTLYDCDFNQALGLAIGGSSPTAVCSFDAGILTQREIRFGDHCFGCTAGSGSSCCGTTL